MMSRLRGTKTAAAAKRSGGAKTLQYLELDRGEAGTMLASFGQSHLVRGCLGSLVDYYFELDAKGFLRATHEAKSAQKLPPLKLPLREKKLRRRPDTASLCALLNTLRELLDPASFTLADALADADASKQDKQWMYKEPVNTKEADEMALRMQEAEAEADRTYLRDDDGEPFDFWTPLFGKPGAPGISLKLGSGVSLFLRMLEVLTAAFLVATLVAIPIMAKSAQGGVLSGLGYASPNVALSLGNRLPYSVDFWPTQALDILYTVVLMTAIWYIQRGRLGHAPNPTPHTPYPHSAGTSSGRSPRRCAVGARPPARPPAHRRLTTPHLPASLGLGDRPQLDRVVRLRDPHRRPPRRLLRRRHQQRQAEVPECRVPPLLRADGDAVTLPPPPPPPPPPLPLPPPPPHRPPPLQAAEAREDEDEVVDVRPRRPARDAAAGGRGAPAVQPPPQE